MDKSHSIQTLTRAQVRELDHRATNEFGVPSIVLMENAGRGAAQVLLELGVAGPVHIVCGKGNNGGDGMVIARHLDLQHIPVVLHLCVDPAQLTGDALVNYQICRRSELPIHPFVSIEDLAIHLRQADWAVDALFGTGLEGPIRPPFCQIIECLNSSARRILAVDLPSGLDADTGQSLGNTVRAYCTVTFVAPKQGFLVPEAKRYLGEIRTVDIGAPRKLLEQYLSPP